MKLWPTKRDKRAIALGNHLFDSILVDKDKRDVNLMLRLIESGADVHVKRRKWTVLHYAARNGSGRVVKALIERGADVNARAYLITGTPGGWTPLHFAAHNNNIDVVRILLDAGADRTIEDKEGLRPIDKAVVGGHTEVAELLRDYELSGDVVAKVVDRPAEIKAQGQESPVEKEPPPQEEKNDVPVVCETAPLACEAEAVWEKQGNAAIARVETYPALQRRVTSLFNFQSRHCTVLTENLKTGQESAYGWDMDANNAGLVQEAAQALADRGGNAGSIRPVKKMRYVLPAKGGCE